MVAKLFGWLDEPDAGTLSRFRQPHHLRGDFDTLIEARQQQANAPEVFTNHKVVGHSNGHARLTYI
jgi:hypothetical protein